MVKFKYLIWIKIWTFISNDFVKIKTWLINKYLECVGYLNYIRWKFYLIFVIMNRNSSEFI